jgi:hypothetical protein
MDTARTIAGSGLKRSFVRFCSNANLNPYKIANSEPMLRHAEPTNIS